MPAEFRRMRGTMRMQMIGRRSMRRACDQNFRATERVEPVDKRGCRRLDDNAGFPLRMQVWLFQIRRILLLRLSALKLLSYLNIYLYIYIFNYFIFHLRGHRAINAVGY